jgi:hypothetical protein
MEILLVTKLPRLGDIRSSSYVNTLRMEPMAPFFGHQDASVTFRGAGILEKTSIMSCPVAKEIIPVLIKVSKRLCPPV